MRKFVANFRRTIKNKLYAFAATLLGIYVLYLSGDGTVLMFLLMFVAIPAFFANEDVF